MTTNQINYLKALETERANRESERIRSEEADIKRKLADVQRGEAYAEYGLTFNPDGTIQYDPSIGTVNRTVTAAERDAYFGKGKYGDVARTFQNMGEQLREWWDNAKNNFDFSHIRPFRKW